jgi:exonuclease VII small subunit
MSFENNLEILQNNSKKLTNTSNNFEELVNIYETSQKLFQKCNIELIDIEEKCKKNTKSRKKIEINNLFELLEDNKNLFESEISLEEKIQLFKNSMSLILLAEDKLKKSELKIIDCN